MLAESSNGAKAGSSEPLPDHVYPLDWFPSKGCAALSATAMGTTKIDVALLGRPGDLNMPTELSEDAPEDYLSGKELQRYRSYARDPHFGCPVPKTESEKAAKRIRKRSKQSRQSRRRDRPDGPGQKRRIGNLPKSNRQGPAAGVDGGGESDHAPVVNSNEDVDMAVTQRQEADVVRSSNEVDRKADDDDDDDDGGDADDVQEPDEPRGCLAVAVETIELIVIGVPAVVAFGALRAL